MCNAEQLMSGHGAEIISMHVGAKARVAERFCALAGIQPSDTVYDLGCGDARVLLTVARTCGAHCVGVEADSRLVKQATAAVAQSGMARRVRIVAGDVLRESCSDATVVFLFLTEYGVLRLRPWLVSQLQPGCRVVTCMVPLGAGWQAEQVDRDDALGELGTLYLYRIAGDERSRPELTSTAKLQTKYQGYQPPTVRIHGPKCVVQ